ncbi:V-type ATP synthase subunit E [Candidatus Thiodiazotropha sp. CDECU1]|uniref:V-type ATP synthase subunit E n=1 Tax=Candidatus Thiodiazotropha sp. CDECU1 TaxID=3065865 RepID=UPI002930957A|nr:V-type ATP synthase subunit E family protein [Candidatus Thiodiazotropha sp. CDECU1]
MNQVEALEKAILERAELMANECHSRAEAGRKNILREASERLHLREEKETLLAKSLADRAYLRKVQADELKLHSKMDHMRWNLVQVVVDRLQQKMQALTQDEEKYFELITAFLQQAAAQIEEKQLLVSVNANDLRRLKTKWDQLTSNLVAGKTFELQEESIETIGGCLITTADNRVQIDHTFEGRLARLERKVHQAMVERLLPPISDGQAL